MILQILDVLQIVIVIPMKGQVLFYGPIQECFYSSISFQLRSIWKINGEVSEKSEKSTETDL